MKLILASASPIRRTLLQNAGYAVDTIPAKINERELEPEFDPKNPCNVPKFLAVEKARNISNEHKNHLVIGADQVLEFGGQLLHKVSNNNAAIDRLMQLSGAEHRLHTAAVVMKNGQLLANITHTNIIKMHEYDRKTAQRISKLDGEQALGSVGAYRIEGPAIQLIAHIQGDHFSVLGLPLLPLIAHLRTYDT